MDEMNILREDRRRLTADLKLILRDTENVLRHKVDEVSEGYLEALHQLEQTAADTRARLDGLERAAREAASETIQETDAYVRDHPWESLGICVGLGVLLGMIVGRR